MQWDLQQYTPRRGMVFLGLLLLGLVVLHYVLDTQCLYSPGCNLPAHWVTRYACLCPIAGLLVGLAMVLGSEALSTYGIVLFVLFPLGATIDQYFARYFNFEWPLAYQLVLIVAVPTCIVAGLYKMRHAPMAIGVSLVGFFVKGIANWHITNPGMPPELQIWLFQWIGPDGVRDHFVLINSIGLAIGLTGVVIGWLTLKRTR